MQYIFYSAAYYLNLSIILETKNIRIDYRVCGYTFLLIKYKIIVINFSFILYFIYILFYNHNTLYK